MLRRFLLVALAFALPTVLAGCPSEESTLGEEIDEAIEEVEDEVDDAL